MKQAGCLHCTAQLPSSLINSTPSLLISPLPFLSTSPFSLSSLHACQVRQVHTVISSPSLVLITIQYPPVCVRRHLMGHTSFALLKLPRADGKQQRQASAGIEKSHAVTAVARRGPAAAANEVLSHETPLNCRYVIPICNFITSHTHTHAHASTVVAAVLHSALSGKHSH